MGSYISSMFTRPAKAIQNECDDFSNDPNIGIPSISKCGICFDSYNRTTRAPKVMSCGHTYCKQCLSLVAEDTFIQCPTCRSHTVMGADGLPHNWMIMQLLERNGLLIEDEVVEEQPEFRESWNSENQLVLTLNVAHNRRLRIILAALNLHLGIATESASIINTFNATEKRLEDLRRHAANFEVQVRKQMSICCRSLQMLHDNH